MTNVSSTTYSGGANRRRLWFFKRKTNPSHHSDTISPCEFQTRMFPIRQRKSKRHARERYLNPSGKRVEISTPALTVPAENRRKLDLFKVLTKECVLSSRNYKITQFSIHCRRMPDKENKQFENRKTPIIVKVY